jgi:hypothetical protein
MATYYLLVLLVCPAQEFDCRYIGMGKYESEKECRGFGIMYGYAWNVHGYKCIAQFQPIGEKNHDTKHHNGTPAFDP